MQTTTREQQMNAQHTPGPWYAAIDMKIRARGCVIGAAYIQPDDIGRANALLIAAAPDLLDALRRIDVLLNGSPCVAAHNIARAAITKATWEQQ